MRCHPPSPLNSNIAIVTVLARFVASTRAEGGVCIISPPLLENVDIVTLLARFSLLQ